MGMCDKRAALQSILMTLHQDANLHARHTVRQKLNPKMENPQRFGNLPHRQINFIGLSHEPSREWYPYRRQAYSVTIYSCK